jgi:hypothetical protein
MKWLTLPWDGPHLLSTLDLGVVPSSPGVYVFSVADRPEDIDRGAVGPRAPAGSGRPMFLVRVGLWSPQSGRVSPPGGVSSGIPRQKYGDVSI